MVNNSTKINKRNNHHLNYLNIKNKTTTYDVGSPGHGLAQARESGGVKLVNGIPTPLLIIGSPTVIHKSPRPGYFDCTGKAKSKKG